MAQFFPPIVDNLSPSFYAIYEEVNNEIRIASITIRIPFKDNRSVSPNVQNFKLKIRTVVNGYAMGNDRTLAFNGTRQGSYAVFVLTPSDPEVANWDDNYFQVGQFYKMQIAYVDNSNGEVGYYSTVTIAKFTCKPTLSIKNINGSELSPSQDNKHVYEYIGHYTQKDENGHILDATEKVYEYRFEIVNDQTHEIVADSGWQVHNASIESQNLQEYESDDYFEYYKEIPESLHYFMYFVKSNSGGYYYTERYPLSSYPTVSWSPELITYLDFDNGYVSIKLAEDYTLPSREYYLLRKCGDEVVKVKQFEKNVAPGEEIMKDLTVEQGLTYSYSLCYFSNNSVYKTAESSVYVDYEDIFLSDNNFNFTTNRVCGRQLKVRLNPSISAIHETLLEQKLDTIGGKYPFFTRNGTVRYRDFQVGGLITLQVDEQRMFSPLYGLPDQPARERTYTAAPQDNEYIDQLLASGYTSSLSDYTPYNYFNERKFREEVLNWLNNGQYKLFRSASEGVLVVRLMNVNLVPMQGTSRLVYSFTAQAYEATGHDYNSLRKNNFFSLEGVNN